MKQFKINYYLERGFIVGRVIEASSLNEAVQKIQQQGNVVQFVNDKGVYHQFRMADVKLLRMAPTGNSSSETNE